MKVLWSFWIKSSVALRMPRPKIVRGLRTTKSTHHSFIGIVTFAVTALGSDPTKIEIEKIHGQNCTTRAEWIHEKSASTLTFSSFQSPSQDQYRTACQVVSRLTVSENQRVRIRFKNIEATTSGEGSLVNLSVSLIPKNGKSLEFKYEPTKPGPLAAKLASEEKLTEEVVSSCGTPTKLFVKAAAFYRGKPQPEDSSIQKLSFQIETEPCQGRQ